MSDARTNAFLTEHLGYSPITVVDDVINAVNAIMYKCTQAVEDYLREREHLMVQELEDKKQADKNSRNYGEDDDDVVMEGADEQSLKYQIPVNEIELGTAKLETLLESSVDKNFDLFELYSLRNIFTIPKVLTDEGWFKLEHHKDLSATAIQKLSGFDQELEKLKSDISRQLTLKRLLALQKSKVARIHQILEVYSKSIVFLRENPNYAQVKPMKENLHFVVAELKNLFEELTKVKRILIDEEESVASFKDKMNSNERDQYLDKTSKRLLKSLGLLKDSI